MQEEIEHKTVNFSISTVKLSARTLLKGAQFFLRQYDKSASQGKQSMKRLIRQNRGVTNLEIEKTGIKDFDRYAKRYHIDYPSSLFRVSGTQRSHFTTNAGTVPLTLAPKSIRDFRRECALTRNRSVPQECSACIHRMQNIRGLGTAQQAF